MAVTSRDQLPSVFLSYARRDDEQLVARLHRGLEAAGASGWFDRVSLPSRALTFVQEIRDAIESRDRMVVFLGPQAMTSAYVEAEWRYALEAAKVVIPVVLSLPPGKRLRDAVPRDLNRLHVVDARGRSEDDVLTEVVRHLREPEPRLGPPLHVPPPPPHYQPRALDSNRLESALRLDSPDRLTASARERILVLHGMGGVGKSVAAAAVARNAQVRRQFSSGIVWVDLGREADVLAGLRRVGAAVADDLRAYTQVEETVARLAERIGAAPLLVVADNAWSDDELGPFARIMGPATRLLVTTRDAGIATRLGAVPIAIEPLTAQEALQQLADWVGEEAHALPESARTVVDECGGLPLALSLVGAMALGGTPWSDISAAIEDADLGFLAEKLPDYPYPDLLRALRVSVLALENSENELDRVAATCFRELAAMRWGRAVPESALVTLWSGREGLPERTARRVLGVLDSKALVRTEGASPGRSVSLHDVLHDLARAWVVDVTVEHGALLDAYQSVYPAAPFIDDDGYFLDHYVHHLRAAGRAAELPAMLCKEEASSNTWWELRLRHGQAADYEADLWQAWADASDAGDIAAIVRWALMIARRSDRLSATCQRASSRFSSSIASGRRRRPGPPPTGPRDTGASTCWWRRCRSSTRTVGRASPRKRQCSPDRSPRTPTAYDVSSTLRRHWAALRPGACCAKPSHRVSSGHRSWTRGRCRGCGNSTRTGPTPSRRRSPVLRQGRGSQWAGCHWRIWRPRDRARTSIASAGRRRGCPTPPAA